VFLLDLISLAKDPDASAVLATTLSRMFSSPDIIKMGLAFKNDLKLLAASYPDLGCFRECKPYLDGSSLLESRDGKVARGKKYGQFPQLLARIALAAVSSWLLATLLLTPRRWPLFLALVSLVAL